MKQQINLNVVIVSLVFLVWGFFFWPTPYRYDTISYPLDGSEFQMVVKTYRLTGQSAVVYDSCVKRPEKGEKPSPTCKSLRDR